LPLRKLNPVTPGQRHAVLPDFSDVSGARPEKRLVFGLRKSGGRNNQGKVTARHRGGGHKRLYRMIDFYGREGTGRVTDIQYDPNRSARIALVNYTNGIKTYIIAPAGLKTGDFIKCGADAEIKPGHRLPLGKIPEGVQIYNIEMIPGRGGKLVRSAGTLASIMVKNDQYAQIKLPSGEVRLIDINCMATIGQVSNPEWKYVSIGKAGRNRWFGKRPTVRGVAMNPVDHPHGGGEGRSKGHLSQSPWGMSTKGYKTRNRKKTSGRKILQRRK